MKERPILMSAPMVRALLAWTKTQTRRAMRVQPGDETSVHVEHFNQTVVDRHGDEHPGPEIFGAWWDDGESGLRCPYGAPSDRLWSRETFFAFGRWITQFNVKKGRDEWHFVDMTQELGLAYRYAADTEEAPHMMGRRDHGPTPDWWKRPAIFMPRAASRTTLEITDVRVERLQDISESDAEAEGVDFLRSVPDADETLTAKQLYMCLWDSINGRGSWDANPWVWAVSFKRI